MTAEIADLRAIRKACRRDQALATAATNRARFGRTKAERTKDQLESERAARTIDSAKRDLPKPEGD
jgi:Domain of unknown function (DUF4169)